MSNPASSERNHLHIIKASAGSGKTHRLTGEYLRLLFASPNNYSHILAVTFTNKATDEMKSRIVEELHLLASGGKSDYLSELSDVFSLSETQVRSGAGHILETILHDYSSFSISTIDRFFQQTMRAFTREMGLSGGYNVEVDDSAFLPEIIDRMLFELDKPENQELGKWLLLFMKNKIEDNRGWSIKNDISELAGELFNEKYKSLPQAERDKIHDKQFLAEYKTTLDHIVKSFEKECRETGKKAVAIMDANGLHYSDFKWGKYSGFAFFVRMANGVATAPSKRFEGLADNIEEWAGKKTPAQTATAIERAYHNGLNDCVNSTLSLFEGYEKYNSARIVLNYFYTLGILNNVQQRLRLFQQENNTLFLSDTTELLHKIIDDSDSPFVYEKTGTRINHYMIDEFQDTSSMQWDNFRPLIGESLASNQFNLIVGDVKQSIYRWRNSDWRLLEEKVAEKFSAENMSQHSLDVNWRSDEQIVRFNNHLFRTGASLLQNGYNSAAESIAESDFKQYISSKITDAYSQVLQHVPPKKQDGKGYVKISFFPESKDDEKRWEERVLEQIPKDIETLQDKGFALKDIAIIVRWNQEAVEIAQTLLKYKEAQPGSPYRYDVISNEALVTGNAQCVKAFVALLRHFHNPNDKTKKLLAVYEYYRFHKKLTPEKALEIYLGKNDGLDFPAGVKTELEAISTLPLYELAESFFLLSKDALEEKENAYVQAFLDIALKFSNGQSADIGSFLDWWDEKGYRKALFSPDNQDAIRIITIHKSKGLGFKAVLMPFVDWNFDHNPGQRDIIWCRPQLAPFNELSIVPLRYSPQLMESIFKEDYLQEKLFTYIDNLNLLYVAFTRAKQAIVAYAPQPSDTDKKTPLKKVSDLLWQILSAPAADGETGLPNATFSGGELPVFELGNIKNIPQNVIVNAPENRYDTTKWQSVPFGKRLKMRLNSPGFFAENGAREYGTLMHEILSNIATIHDLENAVGKAVSAGEISQAEKAPLLDGLTKSLAIYPAYKWYSSNYEVLNETQILHPAFGFSRPDRVMKGKNGKITIVDYKFGEAEESRHKNQVKKYMKYVTEMGYADVEGFIFYVKLGKIVEV